MSKKQKKYVGKQISRRKYRRRVRYDLLVLGLVMIAAGVLIYNIIIAATPPSGSSEAVREKPVNILKQFTDVENPKNESIVLVYKVRGDFPAGSYILGTLDYLNIYIGKEVLVGNKSRETLLTSFIYTVQTPLYTIAEVLGMAFRASNISEVFFNSRIVNTWINVSTESLGREVLKTDLLGDVEVVTHVYRYYKSIEGKLMHIEVVVKRAVNFGLLPVRASVDIGGSRFTLELFELRKVS
ncbi:MAG: hypothetical protein RMI56_07125 [Sulfolobales archaeon]|nr:hypothetical protein [Sulfolobales archaeon]MDW8083540.1 hypothetical protein [Sulfolobales archaeon]